MLGLKGPGSCHHRERRDPGGFLGIWEIFIELGSPGWEAGG